MTCKALALCLERLGKLKILFKLGAISALVQIFNRNIN